MDKLTFDPIGEKIREAQVNVVDKGWDRCSDREAMAALFGWMAERLAPTNGRARVKRATMQYGVPLLSGGGIMAALLKIIEALK